MIMSRPYGLGQGLGLAGALNAFFHSLTISISHAGRIAIDVTMTNGAQVQKGSLYGQILRITPGIFAIFSVCVIKSDKTASTTSGRPPRVLFFNTRRSFMMEI